MDLFKIVLIGLLGSCTTSRGSSNTLAPQQPETNPVTAALKDYNEHVERAQAELSSQKYDLTTELKKRYDLDQYVRISFMETPTRLKFNETQQQDFLKGTIAKWSEVDRSNTERLKVILKENNGWLTISRYGREIDNIAWVFVQHADLDRPFQKEILKLLEPLAATGETDPAHFAYLHDRVSVADHKPQLYGTQGYCTGPGTWEPDPMLGSKDDVDQRRAKVGLKPLNNYVEGFKTICHRRDR